MGTTVCHVGVDLSLTQKACLERVFREAVDRYYANVINGTPSPETPVGLLGQSALTITADLGMVNIGMPELLPVRALYLDGDL